MFLTTMQHESTACATITYKNGEVPYRDCGDEEFCTEKGCIGAGYCTQMGKSLHHYPGRPAVKVTMDCCDYDLCNDDSSAPTSYNNSLSSIIALFVFCFCNQ